MPVEQEIHLADGDHVVQFYGRDEDLVGAVVGYLSGAILDGDTVLVLATAEHREGFEAAMETAAIDIGAARAEGRVLVADAAETLASFMVDGVPDPTAFDAVVGGLVRAASAGGRRVRAYGEMVALLWDAGAVTAAIDVEEQWNALAARTPLALFCAYPESAMSGAAVAGGFSAVCDLHSRVLGGAPLADGDAVRRFPNGLYSPRLARGFVAETLEGWDLRSLDDDAALVVAELAANAVVHAASDFTVAISRRGDGIRLEVGDSSAAAPMPRRASMDRPAGCGLVLVDRIAADWGHRLVGPGKVVWAELTT